MARLQQKRGVLKSKSRKLMALCACGVLALSSGSAFADPLAAAQFLQTLDDGSAQPSSNAVSCSAAQKTGGSSVEHRILLLSESQLCATFECPKESQAIPTALTDVCVAPKHETMDACREAGTNLKDVLQTNNPLAWTVADAKAQGAGVTRTLTLKKEDLPFTDKSFFVGCQASGQPQSPCQVDITVKARSSSVDDKNVVTCAYGAESNPSALQVQITKENNTLTIACGKNGTIKPAIYQDRYCEDEKLSQCSRSYKDILPRFDSSWWTKEGHAASADTLKLTIPREGFPAEEQMFYVGCAPMSKGGSQKVSDVADVEEDDSHASLKGQSTCRVHVTVRASGSALPASSTALIAAGGFGAAFLAGLFADVF
ncbi:SAG-related sequence [Besnoitia besnoiti]|uniref:SAG-related sequence n=1 Tax=Besnoitia besnoiti TaxID=94643 RepID=A0A2A9MGD1_BESBE|nr:SAG-related sequence [Besnoitia besnoiti]PFH37045.1 SAG-related sequence [Besnoitia besnoiti]